jgi:phosphinothricin acetyltransferase
MIRPLTPDDHAAAAAVYNHYVATSTATFQTEPLTPAEWAAEATGGEPGRHGAWAVCGDDGAFAGYLLVQPFKSRCAYRGTAEVTVYLDPAATGRGLGGAAVAYAGAHAAAAGLHALIAVVAAENDASLRLFERHGYERVGHLKEVGDKFGRLLDVVYLEKLTGTPRPARGAGLG